MPILELFILTLVLVLFVVLALSVRLLLTKKGEFKGGSCSTNSTQLKDQGISCGCGSNSCDN
jgi:hypothetical protein